MLHNDESIEGDCTLQQSGPLSLLLRQGEILRLEQGALPGNMLWLNEDVPQVGSPWADILCDYF